MSAKTLYEKLVESHTFVNLITKDMFYFILIVQY